MRLIDHVRDLEKEVKLKQEQLASYDKMLLVFPTANIVLGQRGGTSYLYTKEVNPLVNKVWMGRSCGCCSDSTVIVSPYVLIDGIKVFSDPYKISIGEVSSDYKEEAWQDWENRIRECGLPETIISLVKEYFEREL